MAYLDLKALEQRFGSSAHSELNQKTTTEIKEEQRAFKKIERLVKVRDRSVKEVRERLMRDEFTSQAIEEALDRALRCGYLDDARFADVLTRSRLNAGRGLEGLIRELAKHGIDPFETLDGFPESYLVRTPSQAESAYLLLCRKPPRAKNARQAAYAKLVRNGYSASIAAEATRRWFSEQAHQ